MRKLLTATAIVLAVLATSACTSSGVAAFDRAQTDADELPQWIGQDSSEGAPVVDRSSSRLLADDEGTLYFGATATTSEGVEALCLLVGTADEIEEAAINCAGGEWIGLSDVQFTRSALGEREGWRMIAPNLYIKR